jgi:hypothetical protein
MLRAASAMLCSGCGEFSGTSIMVMPAATNSSQAGTISAGEIPRRMATRRRRAVMTTPPQQ